MAQEINVKVAKWIQNTINRKKYLAQQHKIHQRCGVYYCLSENGYTLNTFTFNKVATSNTKQIKEFMKRGQNV